MDEKLPREIFLTPEEESQFVNLKIENKERKFYIGNAKEYTVKSSERLQPQEFKKIKLILVEM